MKVGYGMFIVDRDGMISMGWISCMASSDDDLKTNVFANIQHN